MPSRIQTEVRPRPRVLMVGFAGHQGTEYLPTVRRSADVVGGVDFAPAAAEIAAEAGFPYYRSLDEALKRVDFDAAVVTVPHHVHFSLCEKLLLHGKHVVKEKPFAVTETEARRLIELAQSTNRSVLTLLQRNFNPVFTFARENLAHIGEPYWFSYDYHLNLARPTSGWRASRELALGGVLLDMGYHLIDVLSGMFPAPSRVHAAFMHRYQETRDRHLEDLVSLMCTYPSSSLTSSLRISRHHHEKSEHLSVLGTEGALHVSPEAATLHSTDGLPLKHFPRQESKSATAHAMFATYMDRLADAEYRAAHFRRQLTTVRTIDGIYRDWLREQDTLADHCA